MIRNGRIVVVNYPMGGGGKFIQNILGLSRYCVLKRQDWAEWQCNTEWNSNSYTQKLAWAISTVPPANKPLSHWLGFELKDNEFFNGLIRDATKLSDFPEYIHTIAANDLWITYTSHHNGSAQQCKRFWPVVKYINVSAINFAARWLPEKNNNPAHHELWRDHLPTPDAFNFDLDRTIYDTDLFYAECRAMYEYLGWDDFDQIPLLMFYQAYMERHPL